MADTPPTPRISDSELAVLKVLWEHGPSTVRAVHSQLPGSGWAYTTVQTLLGRLEEKGHVTVERSGLAHVFRAATDRGDLAGQQIDEVADRILEGAAAPRLLHLVRRGRLSSEDIARFRALLDEAEARDPEVEP